MTRKLDTNEPFSTHEGEMKFNKEIYEHTPIVFGVNIFLYGNVLLYVLNTDQGNRCYTHIWYWNMRMEPSIPTMPLILKKSLFWIIS